MKRQWKWLLPLAIWALLAPFTPHLDLWASSLFYKGDNQFHNSPLFQFFYVWGERFGFILGFTALFVFLASYVLQKVRKWRKAALALVLVLVIGPGLIINVALKNVWGRPRPKQIEQFDGNQMYRTFWQPRWGQVAGDHQKSFPSGHSSMGFYYLSLILVGRRYKSRLLTNSGIGLTAFWGPGLIVTRVVQGAHFVSDVITSPVIMWGVALFVDSLVFREERNAITHQS